MMGSIMVTPPGTLMGDKPGLMDICAEKTCLKPKGRVFTEANADVAVMARGRRQVEMRIFGGLA